MRGTLAWTDWNDTHTGAWSRACAHVRVHTHTHTHTQSHSHTHTVTQSHTHTVTQSHTHTHTVTPNTFSHGLSTVCLFVCLSVCVCVCSFICIFLFWHRDFNLRTSLLTQSSCLNPNVGHRNSLLPANLLVSPFLNSHSCVFFLLVVTIEHGWHSED